jgi:hypothetical protein
MAVRLGVTTTPGFEGSSTTDPLVVEGVYTTDRFGVEGVLPVEFFVDGVSPRFVPIGAFRFLAVRMRLRGRLS